MGGELSRLKTLLVNSYMAPNAEPLKALKYLFQRSVHFVSANYLFNNTFLFLIPHMGMHLKETAWMKKSVSEFIPRQYYIDFQMGYKDYRQKFYMACGISRFSLFSFWLPNSSLTVLFINNIRFHKQLSVDSMFWIPWQKDDQKKSEEGQNMLFFVWLQADTWQISRHHFRQPQACAIMLIFIAASFEQYQVTLSIFTIIKALFMFA